MGTEQIITKAVPGYEGLYEIDTIGRVWSLRYPHVRERKRLKGNCDTKGYVQVVLIKDRIRRTRPVHCIVAEIFIPNPLGKPQVNHKDGVKTNNCLNNLEWMTNAENMQHSYTILGREHLKGSDNGASKLTEDQVISIWNYKGKKTLRQISRQYNVTMAAISLIHTGKTWGWLTGNYGI